MKIADNRQKYFYGHRTSLRGLALVITLAFLVIITILVVGLSTLMTTERPAASSQFEKRRASLMAQMGTDTVVATLNQYVGNANLYWISQPGQLIVSGTAGDNALTTVVPLSSGTAPAVSNSAVYSGANAVFQPPDLNMIDLTGTSHLISDDVVSGSSPVTMPVAWIYLHQDGVQSASNPTTGQPVSSDTTSIVGRYAYWADDESSKINYNMAWGRATDPSYPSQMANQAWDGDQTNINLAALQDSTYTLNSALANQIHEFIVPNATSNPLWTKVNAFFNTPREAQSLGGAAAATLDHFKSDLTNYNHDPNTTFFNQPRIVLTTRPDRAGWTYVTTGGSGTWVGMNGLSGTNGLPHYIRILSYEGTANGLAAVPVLTTTNALYPILTGTNLLDPGLTSNLNPASVNFTLNLLMSYLERSDWPMLAANPTKGSFLTKYYTTGGNGVAYSGTTQVIRLAQLAINIMDYVRCKESPQPMVAPTRAENSGTGTSLNFIAGFGAAYSGDSYFGVTRAPYFTQLAFWNPNGGYDCYVRIEIYNPPNYNIPSLSSTAVSLSIEPWGQGGFRLLYDTASEGYAIGLHSTSGTGTPILPGQYESFTVTGMGNPGTTAGGYNWRVYMGVPHAPINYDMAPQNEYSSTYPPATQAYYLPIPHDQYTTASGSNTLTSIECDDPRCNSYCLTGTAINSGCPWIVHSPGTNSFPLTDGSAVYKPNRAFCSVGNSPNTNDLPAQDTGTNGLITDVSLYMPPPSGTLATGTSPGNPYGAITSVGELGYVCAGVESCEAIASSPNLTGTNPPPTPWRTFSLQPHSAGTGVVPDWALMDIFAAPTLITGTARAVYQPHITDDAVGGRINVNSNMAPFNTGRLHPLEALLQGAPTLFTVSGTNPIASATNFMTANTAVTTASNIYNFVTASKGTLYNYPNAYISQGEVCEIAGVADGGEQSEELVRQIGSLTTARTGVFTIYSIGQALKQTPSGQLTVTAEQRAQTMIERVSASVGASGTSPAIVDFRPVYYRNLSP